jgi:hypothetical protein
MRARAAVLIAALLVFTMAGPASHAHAALPDAAASSLAAPITAVMDAASEPGGGEPGSTGLAAITVDVGNNRLCYELSKVTTTGNPNAAHIHKAPAGQNGPVVQALATPSSNSNGSSSDCVTPTDTTLLAGLLSDPTQYYVNVHTDATPAGAIRGQLAVTANRSAARMNGLVEQTAGGVNDQGDKDGAGHAVVWVNTAQSTVCIRIVLRGIEAPTAFHIHKAAAGSNGPVVVDFDGAAADGLAVTCEISTAEASGIANSPKSYYVNVHTPSFPAGALRGQLTPAGAGYRIVAADGGVFGFGQGTHQGSRASFKNNAPFVGTATTPSREGYWLVGSDGGVFTFGDAGFFGSTGAMKLNAPIIAIAGTPTGKGYWLIASDGGVFTFGDAGFFGSTGAMKLNAKIVGMAISPTGRGYWLVGADGGVFTFGDAGFFGSTGAMKLNKPVVAMGATGLGQGYWLVAADGGVFTFGDAGFFGSTGAIKLNAPVVTMVVSPTGFFGYLLIASDGGVFNFGDAEFAGSMGGVKLNAPVVAATL